jgi:hypothetical protein
LYRRRGIRSPPPFKDEPFKLSGSTDTSVALADIPKREYAAAWPGAESQDFWALETRDPRLVRADEQVVKSWSRP